MIPFILAISVFGVYLTTICPTVYLGDGGELTAAAYSLGIPHNSGYPLYSLLGKAFCLLPFGNIGFRMNLMSVFFGCLTVVQIYFLILKITPSKVGACVGALVLAFAPILWFQTVSAEVYTLHTFFVVLLIRLLWWWDEKRGFCCLALLTFVAGLSFGNHLQTVMLAPGVLFIILSGDRRALFTVKHFTVITLLFVIALSLYLYLPIRTMAGAAIHWGDPDTFSRFFDHVTGRSHRGSYVLNMTYLEYLDRTIGIMRLIWSQFGVALVFSLWGLLKLSSVRWRVFFCIMIFFDLAYAVFLNTISLKITTFALPTLVVLAILIGVGLAHIQKAISSLPRIRRGIQRSVQLACCLIPAIPLLLNFGIRDQSLNYTAYEYALNILRTLEHKNTLLVDGDNNLFPITYGYIAERMREDVELYDRLDILFKLPQRGDAKEPFIGPWEEYRNLLEGNVIEKSKPFSVFYAVFDPATVSAPEQYALIPYGVVHRVVPKGVLAKPYKVDNPFKYYSMESFRGQFERDYHNRQVTAHFFFRHGQYITMTGNIDVGVQLMKTSSRIGYDDTGIHSAIGTFLTDLGLFQEARLELEKMSVYYEDLSVVHNNWGYFYHKKGDYQEAIKSFKKAVELKPGQISYYNNLGYSLYEANRKKEALETFQKSLRLKRNQNDIEKFIRENLLLEEGTKEFDSLLHEGKKNMPYRKSKNF